MQRFINQTTQQFHHHLSDGFRVMATPIFSIVMPAYNSEAFIEEAVLSALNQTFSDFELIIIDDSSTDGTYEIVKTLAEQDKRISVYRNSVNSGVSSSRNVGLNKSKGIYVAFLDSDDIWLPDKLELQYQCFLDYAPVIVYGSYSIINSLGSIIGSRASTPKCNYLTLLKRNHIGNLTAAYDRRILPDLRFLDIRHEDYAFWLAALRLSGGCAIGLKNCLGKYRLVNNSLSSNKLLAISWTWSIYYSIEKLGLLKSLAYTFSQVSKAALTRLNFSFSKECFSTK